MKLNVGVLFIVGCLLFVLGRAQGDELSWPLPSEPAGHARGVLAHVLGASRVTWTADEAGTIDGEMGARALGPSVALDGGRRRYGTDVFEVRPWTLVLNQVPLGCSVGSLISFLYSFLC